MKYICSAKKDGSCKESAAVAPRRGGCCHARPHPADGSNADNSAGKIGTPCSETDAPCSVVNRNVTCVPV
jgi:hypothetical protein